jgi:hypothetical protein
VGEWRTIVLPVRTDILEEAEKQGVDINGVCNRALAAAVGIVYDPREKERIAPRKPVIVVQESTPAVIPPALPAPGPAGNLHPVINADDPAAVSSVKRTKRTPEVRPTAPVPVPAPSPAGEHAVPASSDPAVKPARPKAGKSAPKKKGGSPDLRKFIAETILREDGENASIPKEALYQAFGRWCRERRMTTTPERKALTVALKNQFALSEKVIDGEPSWVNVRLK